MFFIVTSNSKKKAKIWDLWKKGNPMKHIVYEVNQAPAAMFSFLRYHGGIQPRTRIRSCLHLTMAEREEISRGLAANRNIRSIASDLNRSLSTISREIKKMAG